MRTFFEKQKLGTKKCRQETLVARVRHRTRRVAIAATTNETRDDPIRVVNVVARRPSVAILNRRRRLRESQNIATTARLYTSRSDAVIVRRQNERQSRRARVVHRCRRHRRHKRSASQSRWKSS